jgi:hypothetical protein
VVYNKRLVEGTDCDTRLTDTGERPSQSLGAQQWPVVLHLHARPPLKK